MKTVTIDLKRGATLTQLKSFMGAKGPHAIKVRYNRLIRFKEREYVVENISKDYDYVNLIDKKSGARKIGFLKKFKVVKVV